MFSVWGLCGKVLGPRLESSGYLGVLLCVDLDDLKAIPEEFGRGGVASQQQKRVGEFPSIIKKCRGPGSCALERVLDIGKDRREHLARPTPEGRGFRTPIRTRGTIVSRKRARLRRSPQALALLKWQSYHRSL